MKHHMSRKSMAAGLVAVTILGGSAVGVHLGCKDGAASDLRRGLVSTIGNVTGQGQAAEALNIVGDVADTEMLDYTDEDGMGQTVALSLTNQTELTDDVKLDKYVSMVGLTLVNVSPRPVGNWMFGVLDTDDVNAFAGPNGYIFVTRGALDFMEDESELAGVLAHEITHVLHHHGLQGVKDASRGEAVKKGIGVAVQQKDRFGLFNVLAEPAKDVVMNTGYNQPQEFDADKTGVSIVVAAGYDPNGLARFLGRLQSRGGAFSTHPGSAERVKRVQQQIAQLGNPKGKTLKERFEKNVKPQ